MSARPDVALAAVCRREVASIAASVTWQTVVEHPAWESVHALPVVDEAGRFVGVIRYKTARDLQRRRAGDALTDRGQQTAAALGEVFGLGLRGMFQWPDLGAAAGSGERGPRWDR